MAAARPLPWPIWLPSTPPTAPPAIAPFGGRYLARGTAAAAYEAGQKERIVISEFPSVEKATAAYASAAYQEALKALGDGAVSASVEAIGATEVRESRYPGVWRVIHRNEAGKVVADLIEVCAMPEILRAPAEDAADGLIRLKEALQ